MTDTYKIGDKIRLRHPRDGNLPIEGTIQQDYEKQGDGILWVMKRSACIKSHYSDQDRADRAEFDALPAHAVREYIEVEVNGKEKSFRIERIDDASDAAVFLEVIDADDPENCDVLDRPHAHLDY